MAAAIITTWCGGGNVINTLQHPSGRPSWQTEVGRSVGRGGSLVVWRLPSGGGVLSHTAGLEEFSNNPQNT